MRAMISSVSLGFIFAVINSVYGHVAWNFGQDTPDSYVIGRETGNIQFLQKVKRIPLNVVQCHEVTFVRVEVENGVSSPTVRYDEQALAVTISYTWLQISSSTYHILVKGRPIIGCNPIKERQPVGCQNQNGKPIPCEDYIETY